MKFKQHYSGSKGNLYTLTGNDGRVLMIECGVSWTRIQKALRQDISNVDACIYTHEHLDHCKAVGKVMDAGINVYSSEESIVESGIQNYRRSYDLLPSFRYNIFGYDVICCPTHHDAEGSVYYIIEHRGESMLFATDTCYIGERFSTPFDLIAIECNYDATVLQKRLDNGSIHKSLADRILTNHMSSYNCMRYLDEYCNLSKCREIHLLHMSDDNIDKDKTVKEFEDKFMIEVITC